MESQDYSKEQEINQKPDLNFEQKDVVDGVKMGMAEDLQWKINQGEIASFDDLKDAISEYYVDETIVMSLSTDNEISLIEQFAEEFGLEIEKIVPDNIRRIIEQTSASVIQQLAESSMFEAIDNLESFMDEHELDFDNIVPENSHGWARHWGERMEGDNCQIYEYRNLENEQIHFDIWEYNAEGLKLTFEISLSPEEVSDEENFYDAT